MQPLRSVVEGKHGGGSLSLDSDGSPVITPSSGRIYNNCLISHKQYDFKSFSTFCRDGRLKIEILGAIRTTCETVSASAGGINCF